MLGPKSNCWRVVKQLQNICLHTHSSRFTRHTEPCYCEPAPAPVYAMVFCHICNLQQYCKHSDHSREERLWWVLNFERNNDSVLFFWQTYKKRTESIGWLQAFCLIRELSGDSSVYRSNTVYFLMASDNYFSKLSMLKSRLLEVE